MDKPQDVFQTIYRVYNTTTNIVCSDFEDTKELKEYLALVRSTYPNNVFEVYRICTSILFDKRDW